MKIIGTKEEIEQLNEIFRDSTMNDNCYAKQCIDCIVDCKPSNYGYYNKDNIEIEVIDDERYDN